MRLLILLLLLPFYSSAQTILHGRVVEESSGKGIPYVTVGLLKQNGGTNANEQGEFTLNCRQPDLDSLIISCIGYKSLRLAVRELQSNPVLHLSFSEKKLRPIIVKNHWSYGDVGSHKNHQDYCFTSTGYQSQVAKKMTAPVSNAQLQSIQVRTSKYYPKESIFRLHVFEMDTLSKGPGKELTDSLIEVHSKWGLVNVDMSPYQIWLADKDFFISVEWLRISFNEHHTVTKYEGRDTVILTYNPCLCFTKELPSSSEEIWRLDYSGKWYLQFSKDQPYRLPSDQLYSLAISATIKY